MSDSVGKWSRRATVFCLLGFLWSSSGIASASNTSDWFELDLREDLSQWASSIGLPRDQQDPFDRTGPLALPNIVAYAMGFNPLTATGRELPRLEFLNTARGERSAASLEGEELALIYQRNADAVDVDLQIEVSLDFKRWEPADPASEQVLMEQDGIEFRAVRFPFEEVDKMFFRARAEHSE